MNELIEQLQLFGFSQYEARVYISLLEQSPATGYEISKLSGVPASKIYQVLNRLREKNLVLALSGEPARYVPYPPDEVLARLRQRYDRGLELLEDRLRVIYRREPEAVQYIWNISGERAILAKAAEFIDSARQQVFLSIWEPEYQFLETHLLAARDRGITVYMVFFGKKEPPFRHAYLHGRENLIRQQRQGRRLAFTSDGSRMLIAHFPESGTASAAWTENPGLVLLTKDYIVHDIYTIKIMNRFGQEAVRLMEDL